MFLFFKLLLLLQLLRRRQHQRILDKLVCLPSRRMTFRRLLSCNPVIHVFFFFVFFRKPKKNKEEPLNILGYTKNPVNIPGQNLIDISVDINCCKLIINNKINLPDKRSNQDAIDCSKLRYNFP